MSSVLDKIGSSEFFSDKSIHYKVAKSSAFFGDSAPATKPKHDELIPKHSAAADFWHGFEARLRSDDLGDGGLPPVDVLDPSEKPVVEVPEPEPEIDDSAIKDLLAAQPEAEDFQPARRHRLPRFARPKASIITEDGLAVEDQPESEFQPRKLPAFNPEQLKTLATKAGAVACVLLVVYALLCVLFAPPQITGRWYMTAETNGNVCEGEAGFVQHGEDLVGMGADAIGTFNLRGKYRGTMLTLWKSYIGADGSATKPIAFIGDVSKSDGRLRINGKWECDRRVGYTWRSRIAHFSGKWTAEYEDALSPADIQSVSDGSVQKKPNENDKEEHPNGLGNLLLGGAFILILFGVGLIVASLMLFGPGGKINIWEKRKYIPTQFRGEHKKMLAALSQPLSTGGLPLGQRHEWKQWKFWAEKDLSLTPSLRRQNPNALVLGVSGKGKSSYLANMIMHDISSADRAVVLVDSDGGLSDTIMRWIAAHPRGNFHSKRVLIIDPTANGMTATFNPLAMPEDGDLQSAASTVVNGFKAIYKERTNQHQQNDWNPQTAHILRNAALLLMVNGKTLSDLPALLGDNDFRDFLLQSVAERKEERAEYITLLETWNQYKKIARTDQWIPWCEPILNRVTPVLGDARIRQILTSQDNELNLKRAIKEKRIIIVRLPNGQMENHADLIGSLTATGIKQAALSIAAERTGTRYPVALYLDEFDRFIEQDTIKAVTSESDRLSIGIIAAGKTIQDVPDELRNLLLVSFGTICCFALAKKDADIMGPQMFRVDGRRIKHQTIHTFFNRVNAAPQFEFVSDEEKLNIDRLVGRDAGTFFCYRVGSVAGVFHMKAHPIRPVTNNQIDKKLLLAMRRNTCSKVEGQKAEPAPVLAVR